MALVSTPSIVAGLDLAKPLASALEKISAAVPSVHQLRAQHARERLLFDTTPWFRRAEPMPILEVLRAAVWDDGVCRLRYERLDGEVKRYRVDAYALVAKIDAWYFVAATKDGMRVFRVERIRSVERQSETFVRDRRFDLRSFWQAWCARFEASPGHRYEVELELTAAGRDLLLERFGGWHAQALARCDAKARSRVTLDFERESIAIATLLELGGEAVVVRPRSLRTKVAERARAVLGAYARSEA
jgi:predicted DNA-binding transcriptional regulator YafY